MTTSSQEGIQWSEAKRLADDVDTMPASDVVSFLAAFAILVGVGLVVVLAVLHVLIAAMGWLA